MISLLLFCLFLNTDSSANCIVACKMHLKNGANLVIAERRLFKLSGESAYGRQPCTQIIKDTNTKEEVHINVQISWWVLNNNEVASAQVRQIGDNTVTFQTSKNPRKAGMIYATILPNHCSDTLSAIFPKKQLPFVKKTLKLISFSE